MKVEASCCVACEVSVCQWPPFVWFCCIGSGSSDAGCVVHEQYVIGLVEVAAPHRGIGAPVEGRLKQVFVLHVWHYHDPEFFAEGVHAFAFAYPGFGVGHRPRQ